MVIGNIIKHEDVIGMSSYLKTGHEKDYHHFYKKKENICPAGILFGCAKLPSCFMFGWPCGCAKLPSCFMFGWPRGCARVPSCFMFGWSCGCARVSP